MRIPQYKFLIKNLQVNILSMAYRGYSYSDQVKPTEEGLKKDVDAICDFLTNPAQHDEEIAEHINKDLIFGHGRSLGGAVTIHMVEKYQHLFRGVIIENTFTSYSVMAEKYFPPLKLIRFMKPYALNIFWKSDEIV